MATNDLHKSSAGCGGRGSLKHAAVAAAESTNSIRFSTGSANLFLRSSSVSEMKLNLENLGFARDKAFLNGETLLLGSRSWEK